MRKMWLPLLLILLAVLLTLPVYADDNVTTGDGDTAGAAKGYGWYRDKEYLWKASLYVGKEDTASKAGNLADDFHCLGTVLLKKPGWTVPSATKFGTNSKAEYLDGAVMGMATEVRVYNLENCPAVPVACEGGNLDTVKSFFGSTGTLQFLLRTLAAERNTDAETMLSSLSFTIGGRTKTGWDAEMLFPDAESNRVPWVIVYEPVILMHLKDRKNCVAFSATEYIIAQVNGWYDWHKSGGKGQWVDNLTHKHLPTSVLLEESWFGYPVFPPTDGNETWAEDDILRGGGWGMRWLSVSVWERKAVDYAVSIRRPENVYVREMAEFSVTFRNLLSVPGDALCTVSIDGTVIWSQTLSFAANGVRAVPCTYKAMNTDIHTIRAEIFMNRISEDANPDNNTGSCRFKAKDRADAGTEYTCTISTETVYANQSNLAYIEWYNDGDTEESVLCELYCGEQPAWSAFRSVPAGSILGEVIPFYCSGNEIRTVSVRIHYAERETERDPYNNEASAIIFPQEAPPVLHPDFGIRNLTINPNPVYQGNAAQISFETVNLDTEHSYYDIPFEILLNGERIWSGRSDYPAGGRISHSLSVPFTGIGTQVVTSRVNWDDRKSETNPDNNTMTTTAEAVPYMDFLALGLQAAKETAETTEELTLSCTLSSHDPCNSYVKIPVELLRNDEVIWSDTLNFQPLQSYSLTFGVPGQGGEPRTENYAARIHWEDRADEVNPDNNRTDTVTVTRTEPPGSPLSIRAILPNADYREGITVITTFRVSNGGNRFVLPSDGVWTVFTVTDSLTGEVIVRQTRTDVVMPPYGSNLVYFRWTVPEGSTGRRYVCRGELQEYGTQTDADERIRTIASQEEMHTPDTKYERKGPDHFTVEILNETEPASASWEEWVYEDGMLVRKVYIVESNSVEPELQPDRNAFSAVCTDGVWHLASGYGFSVSWTPSVRVGGSPPAYAVTGLQSAYALFPEYRYEHADGKAETLVPNGNRFSFSRDNGGLHFTPLWYPDGPYTVVLAASECWTPAGMLTLESIAPQILISQSAYDDWYLS